MIASLQKELRREVRGALPFDQIPKFGIALSPMDEEALTDAATDVAGLIRSSILPVAVRHLSRRYPDQSAADRGLNGLMTLRDQRLRLSSVTDLRLKEPDLCLAAWNTIFAGISGNVRGSYSPVVDPVTLSLMQLRAVGPEFSAVTSLRVLDIRYPNGEVSRPDDLISPHSLISNHTPLLRLLRRGLA